MFDIWWNGPCGWECIDAADDPDIADVIIAEYRIAFPVEYPEFEVREV